LSWAQAHPACGGGLRASEGLSVLVIEPDAPGGQAGSSSKIENYLGFPTGVSGMELAAPALNQAQKFGAQMIIAHGVNKLICGRRPYQIELDSGQKLMTRTVIIATGAQYNKPSIPNLAKFEGTGVYYGATRMEAQLCDNEEVIVVGGGNSAGQAAVYLSQSPTTKVHMLVRSGQLADTMSRSESRAIPKSICIVALRSSICEGDVRLERVQWRNNQNGIVETRPIRHVFMMTGAAPNTAWLKDCPALDSKGFILTGYDLETNEALRPQWQSHRPPLLLETSLPGVFAVGDARAASAVGEASISVRLVHRVLAEM
jgi:thioredoxin reductase (NADPH)